MHEWMDGWMNWWIDKWMDGWMDGWMVVNNLEYIQYIKEYPGQIRGKSKKCTYRYCSVILWSRCF